MNVLITNVAVLLTATLPLVEMSCLIPLQKNFKHTFVSTDGYDTDTMQVYYHY